MGYKEFGYMYALYGDLFIFEDGIFTYVIQILKIYLADSYFDHYVRKESFLDDKVIVRLLLLRTRSLLGITFLQKNFSQIHFQEAN